MTKLEKEIIEIKAKIEELKATLATFSVSERIKVNTKLIIKDSPDYGKFTVTEANGTHFKILGKYGPSRILTKNEANISWEIVG